MERVRARSKKGGRYFPTAGRPVRCIPSGCAVLDGVLGGGWPLGRVVNIVGDKSSGKTLLAIEACANFVRCSPKGKIWYRESEAAFDIEYAESVGLPVERVNFGKQGIDTAWDTVEDIFEDLDRKLTFLEKHPHLSGLYVIDSLDALSSRAELNRSIDASTFGGEKPKQMSALFRRLVRRAKQVNMAILVISQVRDKIGVVFGEKKTRTGGKALDFYASIIIWLAHIKTHYIKISKLKQAKGIRVLAKTKKNKIAPPFRQCEFDIRFGYGIEDLPASLAWLGDRGRLDLLELTPRGLEGFSRRVKQAPRAERLQEYERVRKAVLTTWKEMAKKMTPRESKYGD